MRLRFCYYANDLETKNYAELAGENMSTVCDIYHHDA